MIDKILDVIKWGLILIIAGAVFYVVCPKYYFDGPAIRCNKITGKVEVYDAKKSDWRELGKHESAWENAKKFLKEKSQ
jgi:hypothetical protein